MTLSHALPIWGYFGPDFARIIDFDARGKPFVGLYEIVGFVCGPR